tara:strand:+ start:1033 stop:2199 length:1167 start_codon:yes stop_codon:yes gene_type:complete
MIPLSKPYILNSDLGYIKKVLKSKQFTDGKFQSLCEKKIKNLIKSKNIYLTHSCTSALEISAILIGLKKNDEVIIPSYGFVSIANAIVLRGAKPVFAEINPDTMNISVEDIKKKITPRTKAIYIIHYAGNSCLMDEIIKIKKKHKLILVEDAAHSFLGRYKNKFLGTIGDIGVFSFHETKNFISGQGGCISINNSKFNNRINNILDKGTNRKNFISSPDKTIINSKKTTKFYSWVDLGSESRAPEISSALLFSQLKKKNYIQNSRKKIWDRYNQLFKLLNLKDVKIVEPLKNSKSAYHLTALIFKNIKLADKFKIFMIKNGIAATFHYVPLHNSLMGSKFGNKRLNITENIFRKVVRLPLFAGMTNKEIIKIEKKIHLFFTRKNLSKI